MTNNIFIFNVENDVNLLSNVTFNFVIMIKVYLIYVFNKRYRCSGLNIFPKIPKWKLSFYHFLSISWKSNHFSWYLLLLCYRSNLLLVLCQLLTGLPASIILFWLPHSTHMFYHVYYPYRTQLILAYLVCLLSYNKILA